MVSSAKRVLAWSISANLAVISFAILRGLLKTGNPSRYFGEGRFTTGVSCLQLLAVAFFAFQTFRCRGATQQGRSNRGRWLWILIAAGFVFLAADDAFQIHEKMDRIIHKKFRMEQTALTDRIDDGIIAVYLLIGFGVLWLFRKEMVPFRAIIPPLAIGFLFACASIVFDTLSNQPDIVLAWLADSALAARIEGWLAVGDGMCELLAEGCFVAAFFVASQIARDSRQSGDRAIGRFGNG